MFCDVITVVVVVNCHEHNYLCERFADQVLQLMAVPNIAVSSTLYWRLNRAKRGNYVNAERHRTLGLSDLFVHVMCHIKCDLQASTRAVFSCVVSRSSA